MSLPPEEFRALLHDLGVYLRQRRGEGEAWYLDEGPVGEGAGDRSVTPRAAVEDGVDTAARSAAAARPAPSARPASGKDDGFSRRCQKFVEDTLARIARNREHVPRQANMFSADPAAPARLAPREKAATLAELAARAAPCTLCKLHKGRTQVVFGAGNPDADLVLIGEAPGREEDRQGEPFVGRAGRLLNEILRAIGFQREDVYICNILKCRPPDNRDPERDEVDACEPYLKQQLAILQPRVICCLGRIAAQTLLGTRASLTALRQTAHFYEGIPVVVTFHPAALLRNPHWKRPTWDDVRCLRALHDSLQK
jgi:uracil-DNA glycosylase family 4